MADDPAMKQVKSMLRSVLLSSKEGVPAAVVHKDYRDVVGEYLPFKKLGFASLEDFITSIPDVVRVERKGGEYICHAVADTSTAHIQKLVSKQRSRKVKKPVRRPRPGGFGDGGKFSARRPGGPPKSAYQSSRQQRPAKSPTVPYGVRHGYPVHMAVKPLTPVTIQVGMGNAATGTRTVRLGTTGSSVMLNKALDAVRADRETPRKSKQGATFEVPPRFRKKLDKSETMPSPSSRPRERASLARMDDSERHIMRLTKLMKNQPIQFDTVPARAGYVSSIVVNSIKFGSEDIFQTAQEAEAAAARNAVERLELELQSPVDSCLPEIDWNDTTSYTPVLNWADEVSGEGKSLSTTKEAKVKERVKEILSNKLNGLWALVIPHEYKEKYKEDVPPGLMNLIRSWTDIAKVELAANTDREIVYFVQDDPNKTQSDVSGVEENAVEEKQTSSKCLKSPRKKDRVMDLYSLYEDTKVKQYEICKNLVIPRGLLLQQYVEVTVYFTYILNPWCFCVQREDCCIEEMTQLLQAHCKTASAPASRLIEKGQYCVGLYSGDNQWTRAEVLQVNDNDTVELMFLDFGNTEMVSTQNVRWLSPELAQEPVQAITCSLYGVKPLEGEQDWSDRASEVFAEQVQDRPLTAIPREIYDDIIEVELFLKDDPTVSISERLVREGAACSTVAQEEESGEPALLTLPDDKQWDVHVTFMSESTDSVMLRLVGEEYSEKLDNFQSLLEEAFHKAESEAELVDGRVYVAYNEELYHRVRVLSTEGRKISCYFLDHGDTDELIRDQLQPLDPAVNRLLSYQVVAVSLYMLEDVSTNITALEKFCDLALGKTCVAEVVDRDIPSVVLYDTSGETDVNINETILCAIEAEGGGIDSGSSASSTPSRVLSPVPVSVDLQTAEGSNNRGLSPQPLGGAAGVSPQDSLVANAHTSPKSDSEKGDNSELAMGVVQSGVKSLYLPPPPPQTLSTSPAKVDTTMLERTRLSNGMQSVDVDRNVNPKHVNGTDVDIPSEQSKVDKNVIDSDTQTKTSPSSVLRRPFNTSVTDTDCVLTPYRIPPVGEYLDVSVTCQTHDPHNFVCIPYCEQQELNQLLMRMQKHFTPIPHPMNRDDIKIGKIYAGYLNGIWCRVKTCELLNDRQVAVYLVDIGEYNVALLTEVQPLPAAFTTLPMMALNAKLGNITPMTGAWTEAAKYKFIELVQGKDLVSMVQGFDKDTGVADLNLIDTSDQNHDINIELVLVKLGYAKWNIKDV